MATNNRDLALKISTLVEGAEDVRELKQELRKLGQQNVPDTTGNFRRGLDRARGLLTSFIGLLSGAALVRGVNNVTQNLREVSRQAATLEESVGTVQELNFAFRQLGLDSDDVNDALNTLADRAEDAKAGTKSFIDDFRLIGIEVEDLRNKSPVELFDLFLERFSQVDDVGRRSTAAVRTFGDDLGRKLQPLLIRGAEGLDKMRKTARDLGVVLDKDTVNGAAEAGRQISILTQVFQAQFARGVAESSDEITDLIDTIADPGTLQSIATFTQAFITGFSSAASFVNTLVDNIKELNSTARNTSISQLEQEAQQLRDLQGSSALSRTGVFTLNGERQFYLSEEDIQGALDQINGRIAVLRAQQESGPGAEDGGSGGNGGGFELPPRPDGSGGQTEAEKRAQSIDQIIDRLREQKATTGEAAVATEVYQLKQLGAKESTVELAQELIAAAEAQEREAKAKEDAAEATDKARESNQDLIESLKEERDLLQIEQDQGARAAFIERTARRLERGAGVDVPEERIRSLAGSIYDLREQSEDTAEGMSEFFAEAAREIQSSLADFLIRPFEEGLDGLLASFADTIQRMAAEAAAAQITDAVFGSEFGQSGELGGLLSQGASFLGGLFGGGGGGGAAAGAGDAGIIASIFHRGGVVGGAAPSREVSPAAFAGAPRFHAGGLIGGLRNDELPIIARRGEEVLTMSDPRHRDNAGGGPISVENIIRTRDPDTTVQSRAVRERRAHQGLQRGRRNL